MRFDGRHGSPPIELKEPRTENIRKVVHTAIDELAKPPRGITLDDWPSFSQMTGGFRPREFTIFCGPTGAGKTTFLANISAQLLKQGDKHFVMSVESGHTDFMKRILSVLDGRDLNTGEVISSQIIDDVISRHMPLFTSGNIEFSLYDNRVPVEQLMHDIRAMVARGCKIAMIDNLNFFMEVTRAADSVIEMDRVIHELIIFCKQVDVHILMVMHPNKENKTGRVETEFDIKGSSTAVQEAHNVLLFNRPKYEDIQTGNRNKFHRELKINKMRRRGQFSGTTLVFSNMGTRYVEQGVV